MPPSQNWSVDFLPLSSQSALIIILFFPTAPLFHPPSHLSHHLIFNGWWLQWKDSSLPANVLAACFYACCQSIFLRLSLTALWQKRWPPLASRSRIGPLVSNVQFSTFQSTLLFVSVLPLICFLLAQLPHMPASHPALMIPVLPTLQPYGWVVVFFQTHFLAFVPCLLFTFLLSFSLRTLFWDLYSSLFSAPAFQPFTSGLLASKCPLSLPSQKLDSKHYVLLTVLFPEQGEMNGLL